MGVEGAGRGRQERGGWGDKEEGRREEESG